MKSQIYTTTNDKMEKTVSVLKEDLNTIRTGRANPKMLDKINVDYYGSITPIKQIATIAAPEPRTLQIQPWDRSAMGLIEKAIQTADLGLNPTNDGNVIRISIPQLTEERSFKGNWEIRDFGAVFRLHRLFFCKISSRKEDKSVL